MPIEYLKVFQMIVSVDITTQVCVVTIFSYFVPKISSKHSLIQLFNPQTSIKSLLCAKDGVRYWRHRSDPNMETLAFT